MHAVDAWDSLDRATDAEIVDAFRHAVKKNARRVAEDLPGCMQKQAADDERENRVGNRRTAEVDDGARDDGRHGAEQVAHHVQKRRARVHILAVSGEGPGNENVDHQTHSRDRHDGKAGDGFGRHDARDGLEEDPSHDAEHHETVNEGGKHLDAAVTKGVVVVRPLLGDLVGN